jgi:DNA polymerase III, delta' subunit
LCFKNLVGNENNKYILKETITKGNILHSYMFFGTEGIGKKLFALEFAKMILCENQKNSPCEKCKSCIEFDSNNNPDFFFIEPDGNSIKIDQIRNMQKGILEKPIISSKKVYIINNAETMTKEAQNCLLKTLEEPQEYVVIILIVSDENSMLPTIKSRCTKIFFEKISDENLKTYIKEKIGDVHFEESMIKLSEGSIGKCIEISKKQEILKKIEDFINNIENMDEVQIINASSYFNENKEDINLILDYIYILIFNKTKELSNKIKYIFAMEKVQNAKEKLSKSNNFDMTIDNMLIEIWREINEKNYRS